MQDSCQEMELPLFDGSRRPFFQSMVAPASVFSVCCSYQSCITNKPSTQPLVRPTDAVSSREPSAGSPLWSQPDDGRHLKV